MIVREDTPLGRQPDALQGEPVDRWIRFGRPDQLRYDMHVERVSDADVLVRVEAVAVDSRASR